MNDRDIRALVGELASVMREFVTAQQAPLIERINALEAIEKPVQGEKGERGDQGPPGAAGAPGLSFEAFVFDVKHDGERNFSFEWLDASGVRQSRSFEVPIVLDRGVYRGGENYRKGDLVTFGGSGWIAQEETSDKPELSKAWRLAVKRGRDGKDARAA